MKYEKVAVCPVLLDQWLELINSVPYGQSTHLRDWEILLTNAFYELTGIDMREMDYPPTYIHTEEWEKSRSDFEDNYQKAYLKAIEALKKETKEFPKLYSYLFELKDFIAPENIYDEIRLNAKKRNYEKTSHIRYETFIQMRRDIRHIAFRCMEYRKTGRFSDSLAILNSLGWKGENKGYLSDFVIIDGKIDFESELQKVLRGIAPERLRVCPICKKVFWAKRIEANTCQEKRCSNNFHQRKLRIIEYEKRLDIEFAAYKKLESNLSPENSLIEKQREEVNKLIEKINREKIKNGTL